MEEKPIIEWLKELKGKAGERARELYDEDFNEAKTAHSIDLALAIAFDWDGTEEVFDYWDRWCYALREDPNAVWHPDEEYDAVTVNRNWEYDVKCRKCGKITRMYHSTHEQVSKENFTIWAKEHSTFPVEKQCSCDNGMMMLHDIVSYGNVLFL